MATPHQYDDEPAPDPTSRGNPCGRPRSSMSSRPRPVALLEIPRMPDTSSGCAARARLTTSDERSTPTTSSDGSALVRPGALRTVQMNCRTIARSSLAPPQRLPRTRHTGSTPVADGAMPGLASMGIPAMRGHPPRAASPAGVRDNGLRLARRTGVPVARSARHWDRWPDGGARPRAVGAVGWSLANDQPSNPPGVGVLTVASNWP